MRVWYDELCDTARREVGAELDDYPFDLAWTQYRRAALGTTVYPVTAMGAMDPANERGRELVTAMAVRSFTAALDLDAARCCDSLRAEAPRAHPRRPGAPCHRAWWRRRPGRGQSKVTRAPVPDSVT